MKMIALAAFAILASGAGISTASAGHGSVLLALSDFETRCELEGGAIDGDNTNLACDFGDMLVSCEFAGAYANCGWDGMQNRRVVRLIGQVTPVSLSEGATGCIPTWENGLCNPNWGIPD